MRSHDVRLDDVDLALLGGDECVRHAHHHEHCRVCAEAFRRCEQVCEDLLSSIGA